MLDSVINYTNVKINKLIDKLPNDFNKDYKYPYVQGIDAIEMSAFIGLCYYRGLSKLNTISIQKLFSDKYGPPIYSATMSRNRFLFILRHISFDDEDTRDERWRKDRFAAFRSFFKSFNRNCMTCLAPGDYLSLDDTLYPMRTQIGFRQYNPNKPYTFNAIHSMLHLTLENQSMKVDPITYKEPNQTQYWLKG